MQESEYVANRLQKRVEVLAAEKLNLQKEKAEMKRQVRFHGISASHTQFRVPACHAFTSVCADFSGMETCGFTT